MRFLSFFVLILALSGCRSIMDPTFMPASYSYHNNLYKSPPGPPAADIGYPYSEAKNAHIMGEWQTALDDLLNETEQSTGLVPSAVYVHDTLVSNAFNNAYDFALREALRKKGYILATTPSASETHISYSAQTKNDTSFTPLNKKTTYRDFDLTLSLSQDQAVTTRTYNLPSYGYEAQDSGHDIFGIGDVERTRSRPVGGERRWND